MEKSAAQHVPHSTIALLGMQSVPPKFLCFQNNLVFLQPRYASPFATTMRLTTLSLLALLLSAEVMAQPSPEAMAAEVTDNVATEYAECSAFFSIVHGAFSNSGKQGEAEKFKEVSNKAAMFSLLAAKQSRSEEMATKVTLARIEMSMRDMQKTIENNYSNISLLTNKHLSACINVMNDSAPLIQRWTDHVQKKYEKR